MFLLGFFFTFLLVHNFCLMFSFEPSLAHIRNNLVNVFKMLRLVGQNK